MSYANGYTYRRTITIDNTKVPSTQSNFPVLVSGTYSYLATTGNGGKVENDNGYDIIFTSDENGATQLSHEIESYNATTGEIAFWVKVPTVSGSVDTDIYMFYGNSSISNTQESVADVWSNGFTLVSHMKDLTTSTVKDSVGTFTLDKDSADNPLEATGKIGQGQDFSTDGINSGENVGITGNASRTMSCWIYVATPNATFDGVIGWGNPGSSSTGAGNQLGFDLLLWSDRDLYVWGGYADFDTTVNLDANTWYLLHVVYAGNQEYFVYAKEAGGANNQSVTGGNFNFGDLNTDDTPFRIGVDDAGRKSDSTIDEVRVSSVARSADWITTEFNSQDSPSTFYSVGAEEEAAAKARAFGIVIS